MKPSEELQKLIDFHESSEGKYAPTDDLAAFLWQNRQGILSLLKTADDPSPLRPIYGDDGMARSPIGCHEVCGK